GPERVAAVGDRDARPGLSEPRMRAPVWIGSRGRTALVAVFAGTLVLAPRPPSSAEQAPRVLVVGPIDGYGALVGGVSEGLQSAGFADASRIRIDTRNARSGDEAKAAIETAVDAGVDAILTVFGPSTQAARAVTTTIPIVFCPVEIGRASCRERV